ncbi:MAG: L-2-amino-thiazoline-4-carboxylic acid hydrolase [Candidatus Thorarchaeota archaeon]|jgi:hypothetical protein
MSNDEQLEQLIQYFFMLTENHLCQQYGVEQSKDMLEVFKTRFRELLDENKDVMPDALSRKHGVNPVFVMALDDALGKERPSLDHLKRDVLGIYNEMMQAFIDQMVKQFEASKDPWTSFIEFTKVGNKNNYENDYFQLSNSEYTDDKIGFDIKRCLYFDILEKNGRPELGPILCDYDYILADAVRKWGRFERKETIADGNTRCDFRYYRV